MRTLLNLLWLVLPGFWMFLGYACVGVVMFSTIIGIPFGVQSFKLAGYALWPFGRAVIRNPTRDLRLSGQPGRCDGYPAKHSDQSTLRSQQSADSPRHIPN